MNNSLALSRRTALLSTTALTAAGCSEAAIAKFDSVVLRVIRDGKLIVAGLKAALTSLAQSPTPIFGFTPAVAGALIVILDNAYQVLTSLDSVRTLAEAKPIVEKLKTYAVAFVASLGTLQLPPQVMTYISAAGILLPILLQAVDIATDLLKPPPVAMTVEQARGTLEGAALVK